jgi:cell pole-organizing protein PopZ
MSEAGNQQEPSMEEILASIRKIISEDGDEAPQADAGPPPEPAPKEEPLELLDEVAQTEEPLELTDEVPAEDDGEIEIFDAAPEPVPEPEPMFVPEPVVEPAPEPEIPPAPATEAILSDFTKSAGAAAFGELSRHVEAPRSNITVEQMAEELMRPMLRQWLDDNLPDMVERLVRREIERMARTGEES